MPVRFFQILNSALTQGVSCICSTYGISQDEAIQQVRCYLDENSAAYYSDAPLRYNDPLCRVAYLYTYVAAHANLIDNTLLVFQDLRNFVMAQVHNNGRLYICSMGGGPGSELLGFVKFIERTCLPNSRIDIDFVLVDNVPEWDETWQALVNGLEATFEADYGPSCRDWPIVVHRSFLSLDLTQVQNFQNFLSRFDKIQIYVLNHTVSELMSHAREFTQVFADLAKRASNGAYFLFIDRNQSKVVDLVDRLIQAGELASLGTYQQQTNMDPDEQKTDLGEWYDLMGRDPKLTWNAFFTLAQKQQLPF